MKKIIEKICKELDIAVSRHKNENCYEYTFSKFVNDYDFNFYVIIKEDDIDSFVEELENVYESYDPDEETALWIGEDGHGKRGAPYHLRDILETMEECEKEIKKLLDKVKEYE